MRSVFFVLGIYVREDSRFESLKKNKPKLLVCNHISEFDPLVVNLLLPCCFAKTYEIPKFILWWFKWTSIDSGSITSQHFNEVLDQSSIPVLCFPESSTTNGRAGLLQFENWPFSCDNVEAHVIFLKFQRFFFNVKLSPLESNSLINLFWIMFLPMSCFDVK